MTSPSMPHSWFNLHLVLVTPAAVFSRQEWPWHILEREFDSIAQVLKSHPPSSYLLSASSSLPFSKPWSRS